MSVIPSHPPSPNSPSHLLGQFDQINVIRGRVRKGIPRFCYYFFSTERNSEMFSLPRKDSERNSEVLCSAEQPEFRRKEPFVPSIPSSAELFFCRKFPTLGISCQINGVNIL